MRIGLFTDTYFPQINGVGASVHVLAEQLRALGHTVYIITPADPRRTDQENNSIISMASMPFVFLRQFRAGVVFSPREMNRLNHLHLDIIHTQTEFSLGVFGKLYANLQHLPMVHTYHTMYADYTHYIAGGTLVTSAMAIEFSKLFCNAANQVVAPTEKVRQILRAYGVVRPIRVIPTGIRLEKFRKSRYKPEEIAALRREIGLAPDTPVVLSLGRVAMEKSIDVVIDAMPALLQKLPAARLVIVGDGPYASVLKEQIRRLRLEDKVLFLGAKPWEEIGKYYQLGDVFVSASTSETQGLTFAEAMAAGVPVLAKKDESIHGLLRDEENGLVFDTNASLADRLYELLADPQKRARLAQTAMTDVEALSAERFGQTMEDLYAELLVAHARVHQPLRAHLQTVTNSVGQPILKARVAIVNAAGRPKRLIQRIKSEREKVDV